MAKSRLDKWHAERRLRREYEDRVAEQEKANQKMHKALNKYELTIKQLLETKRRLKKEWADKEDAQKRGGVRQWPIWVVQLICELLVNGTAPSQHSNNV